MTSRIFLYPDPHSLFLKVQAATSVVLITAPAWNVWIQDLSSVAAAIASICGALVGIHAVWRTWSYHCQYREWMKQRGKGINHKQRHKKNRQKK